MTQYIPNKQSRWGVSQTHTHTWTTVWRDEVTCLGTSGGNCSVSAAPLGGGYYSRPAHFPTFSPAFECPQGSFSMLGQCLTPCGPLPDQYKRSHRYRASRLAGWKHQAGVRSWGEPLHHFLVSRIGKKSRRLCVEANMEVFQAKDHYILQSGDNALWCSRKDGSMTVRPGNAFISLPSHCCHSWRVVTGRDCFKE